MKRRMITERFLLGMLVFVFVLALGTAAQATPSLGVGTGTVDCTGATFYWQCFSGNSASGSGESFVLPSSGTVGGVTVWSNIYGTDMWLLADPSIGDFSFKIGGTTLNSVSVALTEPVDGYVGPFKGINLGQIDGTFTWFDLPNPFAPPAPGFQGLTGTLTYAGTDVTGDWLFLVADIGNNYSNPDSPFVFTGKDHDEFSPKTTSATGVPEAGALLMFGTGLIGLVGYRRVRRMQ